jgi:transposase
MRQLADLPWLGVAMRLELQVRKFFCQNPACPRRIFTERLPGVAAPYSRHTARLENWLSAVSFALGGEAGARLLRVLGLASSPDRLLVRIRRAALGGSAAPRVLGVDDFALRRGHAYGTLLVDLERHCPIDALPDRSAGTLAAWLRAHPGVEVISRDRGGDYAEGARQGAPDAVQVADRFHLVKNLGEVVERILQRHALLVQRVPVPHGARATAAPPRRDREARRARASAKTTARFDAIGALAAKGLSRRAIARVLGLNRKTVQRYLAAATAPTRPRSQRRTSIMTPYEPYLLERWRQGEHNGLGLWREIVPLGYPGTRGNVARFVAHLRHLERTGTALPTLPSAPGLTPRRASSLLLVRPETRSRDQQAAVGQLRALHPELDQAISLLQRFAELVRMRGGGGGGGGGLDPWLDAAASSGLTEMETFVTKLRQDHAAVLAGLTLPWSQGQTEGQITRLKLLKRSMYGRAKFDLLRQRVLARAA